MNKRMQDNLYSPFYNVTVTKTQQRKTVRNQDRALALEEAMFDWKSRHLILILTLSYKEEWRPFINLEQLQRDRDTFLNNARYNTLLQGINGYIWKIEEGEHLGGLHMHMVIFYDGTHRADIYTAKLIGEYWENVVTRGRGDYWNSNADKDKFERGLWGNCTGQIDRSDLVKRESLRTYLRQYIAKDDQHVSTRTNLHTRTFGSSQFPI